MYNRSTNQIGIRAASDAEPYAFLVRSTKGTSTHVAGMSFCTAYGIDRAVTRRWRVELVDGLVVLDLREQGQTVTSNRKKA